MSAGALPEVTLEPPSAPPVSSNALHAARNALKLGGSLLATWCVALVVRFVLPKHLGPAVFGTFNLADTLAATYFVLLSLGVEVYIQKEISLRPAHASDFFGGLLLARALLSLPLLVALHFSLERAGAPPGAEPLVLVFGIAQLAVSLNGSLAALLQAHGTVGRLAVANVVSKVVWGVGVGVGMLLGAPLTALAGCFLLSEVLRAVMVWPVVRRELRLTLRLDLGATRAVLLSCVPFFVNAVSVTLCSKLDVTMLGVLTRDAKEVGWYGAASNVASLSMLLSPLVNWVIMPMLARARAESHERFLSVLRSCIAGLITAILPVSLIIGLGSDLFIHLVFGDAFAPAALSLRAIVPIFLFTYLGMLLSLALVTLERGWTLTAVSLVGVVLNPLLALVFVPLASRAFGPGGAGVGSAAGVVGMEVGVCAMFMWVIGREVLDRPTVVQVLRSVASCGAVILLHWLLAPLGPARLVLDALAYVLFAWMLGAIRPVELLAFVRGVLRRDGAAAAAPPA